MEWAVGHRGWIGVALALLLSGCVDGGFGDIRLEGLDSAPRAGFDTVDKGSYSGHETQGFRGEVAWTEAQWTALWKSHKDNQRELPPAPVVDFTSHFVVAAFMGRQNSGGFSIEVVDVPFAAEKYLVGYATVRPDRDCITMAAITHPFHVVAVERLGEGAGHVVFHNAGQNTRDC